jgi:hypothetical protein
MSKQGRQQTDVIPQGLTYSTKLFREGRTSASNQT